MTCNSLFHGNFDFSKVTIYLVGGFVRDHFLGVTPKDKDYVVVGSSPEEMLSLGFKKVGADFPVFLHPETKDEYALARTERKAGTGYKGFECEWEGVTIEEDLSRRDLTINSIGWDCSRNLGKIIDPYNGISDIKDKILRPTTEHFKDDPLRVLRLLRFKSRYGPLWSFGGKAVSYIVDLINSGELLTLTPERIWIETEKALSENYPSFYFDLSGGTDIFPEYEAISGVPQRLDHHPEDLVGIHTDLVMDYAAQQWRDPEIVFSCLCHDFGKKPSYDKYHNALEHELEGLPLINAFCDRYKVPNRYRELALMTCEHHTKVHGVLGRSTNKQTTPKSIMKLFEQTSALTKPVRFSKMLKACQADNCGRGLDTHEKYEYTKEYFLSKHYPQRDYLIECLEEVLALDTKSISKKLLANGKDGAIIGLEIRAARINAIRGVRNKWKAKSNT